MVKITPPQVPTTLSRNFPSKIFHPPSCYLENLACSLLTMMSYHCLFAFYENAYGPFTLTEKYMAALTH